MTSVSLAKLWKWTGFEFSLILQSSNSFFSINISEGETLVLFFCPQVRLDNRSVPNLRVSHGLEVHSHQEGLVSTSFLGSDTFSYAPPYPPGRGGGGERGLSSLLPVTSDQHFPTVKGKKKQQPCEPPEPGSLGTLWLRVNASHTTCHPCQQIHHISGKGHSALEQHSKS